MNLATGDSVADILAGFGGDPQRAAGLAAFLGFEPIANPEDRLAGALVGDLKRFLRGSGDEGYGVRELYRVGSRQAAPADAGLWIGVLSDWGYRSTDRDRARRRITRALVEHVPDRRALALLVPPRNAPQGEAELIFPRTQIGSAGAGATSVRAHLDLERPTRFHRDLLRGLRIPTGASLLDVSRLWQQQFSVERVTKEFYQKYTAVRDRMARALRADNQDHPVVASMSDDDTRAWATRQMGRVLFLWFLQAKRWLGAAGGLGSFTYLRELWDKRGDTPEGGYYRGLLVPLFFEALATGSSSEGQHAALGVVPYLNGGLFRRSALEDRIDDAGEVSLPDEVFDPGDDDSLLGLLSRYRFTTRESTPDDQSVDPDPELLGRVFENLYQGDERHDTGTYYTPREIVHFMCREALDGYLRDATGVPQGTLNDLRKEAAGSRDDPKPLTGIPAAALVDALETVRVCDPAVGSGAFLLGAIQEIVQLRRGILFTQRPYVEPEVLYRTVSDWKRQIIENSLFGVDLNPEAVEICRLRLWLSMVLDMENPPAANDDWALPNLDFQIVAGDSLVDRVAGFAFKESWPPPQGLQLGMELQGSLQRLESNIDHRRDEFKGTHRNPSRLRELRDLIARDQREIIRLHLADALAKAEGDLEALRKADRLPSRTALSRATALRDRIRALLAGVEAKDFSLVQKPFLWPIAFPKVLQGNDPNAGFDIVLANPPYVRQEKLDAEDQRVYEEAFPEVHTGMADILVYFYARALQILRSGGWMSFITSNKFMRAGYGAGIREHLPASLRISRVVDFGDLPLFETNGKEIAAYPAVLVGNRANDAEGHALKVAELTGPTRSQLSDANLKVNAESVRGVLEDLDGLLAKSEVRDFPQALLKRDGWVLEDPALIRLFERLMNQGTPLREIVEGHMYRGVITGLNEAFVIDQAKRDALIEEDPRSAQLIKPWLRGRDIKRWQAEWAGLYVIAIQNSGDAGANNPWANATSESRARSVFKTAYPAIYDHLSWFEPALRDRQDHGKYWWELRACAYYHEFVRPKIVWGNLAVESKFARDPSQAYISAPANLLIEPAPWLLALLNSSLLNFIFPKLTVSRGGSFQEFKIGYIQPTPIVTPDGDAQAELEALAQAGAAGAAVDNGKLDDIVYSLYGMSQDEVALVREWYERRSLG